MTNGRLDLMDRTIPNLNEMVVSKFKFDRLQAIDDSGQSESWQYMLKHFPENWNIVFNRNNKGLATSVQIGWNQMREMDYIFHVEDDFLFHEVPPLLEMVNILEWSDLSQIILKRNPVNFEEIAAGGYIELNPWSYHQREINGVDFIVHDNFFSLNPGVIPYEVFHEVGWPKGNEAEMIEILNAKGLNSAIWGKKTDPPLVEHIGHYRPSWWSL